jgi:hypothetical protein
MANSAIAQIRLISMAMQLLRAQQSVIPIPAPQRGNSADSPIKVEGPPEPFLIRTPRTGAQSVTMTGASSGDHPQRARSETGYLVLYDDIKIN